MAKLGLNAKLYWRSAGSYEAPTWTEVDILSDVSINQTWDEADASTRESRIRQTVKTLMALEISATMKKKPGDAAYAALMDAFLSDDTLDLLVLDGDKDTEGTRGWRADFLCFGGTEDQAMDNALFMELTFKPSIEDNPPKAVLVAAGPTLTYSEPGVDGGIFA